MTSIKTTGVRYVGTKPLKKDTVCKSLTVWFGENDVQQVPENDAKLMFAFPLVFQPEEVKPLDRPKQTKAPATEPDPVVEEPENTPDEGGDTEPSSTDPVTAEEIAGILEAMDRDTEFTQQGKPKVDAIRDRFPGRKVDSTAVKAAWTAFTGE